MPMGFAPTPLTLPSESRLSEDDAIVFLPDQEAFSSLVPGTVATSNIDLVNDDGSPRSMLLFGTWLDTGLDLPKQFRVTVIEIRRLPPPFNPRAVYYRCAPVVEPDTDALLARTHLLLEFLREGHAIKGYLVWPFDSAIGVALYSC